MSLLVPLGLLGLSGIIALILIYIIKPNYQNKFISSTYIWKLSLKYKKKSVPINRIRNILIFLCQLLILISCALLLAQPAILSEKVVYDTEKVVIIDASASMLIEKDGETRFERAVDLVKEYSEETAEQGGIISVILADGKAHYLAQRVVAENVFEIYECLDELVTGKELACSYGSADMEGAVDLAEDILVENPETEIILYTATNYIDKGGINVVDVSAADEWNVAVSDCRAVLEDNYYTIEADVGCYGRSLQVTVYCDVVDVNGSGRDIIVSKSAFFDPTQAQQTIVFDTNDLSLGSELVYSFEYVRVYLNESDSLSDDNTFYVYGGTKPSIKVLYYSSKPNIFVRNVLLNMRSLFSDKWDVTVTEKSGDNLETEGYDFYVFEHKMPSKLPADGISVLFDPDISPEGSGLNIGQYIDINRDSTLAPGTVHPVTRLINPANITVSQYRKIVSADGYEELMYYRGDPVLLVRNDENLKATVLSFNIHYSNLAVVMEFPMLFYNMFNYFLPSTFSDYAYTVGDTVTLNARGDVLNVNGPDINTDFTVFPQQLTVTRPGVYTLLQNSLRENNIKECFFVGISEFESNITKEVDSLPALHIINQSEQTIEDLLLYFAAALVALLFLEWFLQSREYLR